MGSDPVTVVANSVHRHDQSIGLGIYYSDTALQPDWNEAALHHAGNTSVVVFIEEHSLRVLAVHLAKSWRKYHLSDVAGKCNDQSIGHQWHHTTRLWKRDVGSCCRQFHVDYHDPINGVSCIVDYIVCKMTRYTSTAPNFATDGNRTHVYVQRWHFWLRTSSGIKTWNTDLKLWESGEHYTQKECIRILSSAFSILNPRTCVTGWICAVGLILIPIWFIIFCSPKRPTQGEHERTTANSQRCKKHQQRCSSS